MTPRKIAINSEQVEPARSMLSGTKFTPEEGKRNMLETNILHKRNRVNSVIEKSPFQKVSETMIQIVVAEKIRGNVAKLQHMPTLRILP